MGIEEIKPIITLYLQQLRKKIIPQELIIFGSYAKGTANRESDLDLVVISKDFTKYSTDKRFSLLQQARLHPQLKKVAMDVFGFTPEEYDSASNLTTVGEVKETGISAYSRV